MLRRDGNRVWLDLDEFYPPPHQHPNTVFKSLAIAFQTSGANTSYVDLMGVSAAAFRLQVGRNLCASSPHPHLGFSCASLAQESLGYALRSYEWDPKRQDTIDRAKQAVVASVERGRPALTDDEETGLAIGYVDRGNGLLVREPYSNRGDAPVVLAEAWDGWGMTTIEELPKAPTREGVVKSLTTAVTLANTTELLGNGYASGFNAYDRWITALRDPALFEAADVDAGAIVLGNAHICYCLIDARKCAAAYLHDVAVRLAPETTPQLYRAAEAYESLAKTLDTRRDVVPWPWQLRDPSAWNESQRHSQVAPLTDARELEREAVEYLEEAVAMLR